MNSNEQAVANFATVVLDECTARRTNLKITASCVRVTGKQIENFKLNTNAVVTMLASELCFLGSPNIFFRAVNSANGCIYEGTFFEMQCTCSVYFKTGTAKGERDRVCRVYYFGCA